jgi:hypothetical protein
MPPEETPSPDQQKIKIVQQVVTDPILQISENGYTPLGNLKTYGVQGLYDRPEPTNLRDLPELYTVPYTTSPFLGNVSTSRKDVDVDSEVLRYPVYNNKKSAIDISQVVNYPQQVFIPNNSVSKELNNFYEQSIAINLPIGNYETSDIPFDETKIGLGQPEFNNIKRQVNRWNIVDPRITQNVEHIIMNMVTKDGSNISLPQCGLSTRNELRNYVEKNSC